MAFISCVFLKAINHTHYFYNKNKKWKLNSHVSSEGRAFAPLEGVSFVLLMWGHLFFFLPSCAMWDPHLLKRKPYCWDFKISPCASWQHPWKGHHWTWAAASECPVIASPTMNTVLGWVGGKRSADRTLPPRPCLSEVEARTYVHKQACPNIYGAKMRVSLEAHIPHI